MSLTPSPTGEREQTGEYVDQPPPEIDGNPSVPAVPPSNLPSPQSQGGLPKTGGDMDEETRVPDIPLGSPDDTRQPEDEEVAPQPEEGELAQPPAQVEVPSEERRSEEQPPIGLPGVKLPSRYEVTHGKVCTIRKY